MWDYGIWCGIAALCLSKWAWEADYANFTTATLGNGFFQCAFGRGALGLAPPACYRILFPFLTHPDRSGASYDVPEFAWDRWCIYQLFRFLVIWLALTTLATSMGLWLALVTAALFGLTIRYDYWSNTVELLAVSLVLAGGVLGWHWGALLAAGLVLGTGRETLPFLALLGTPHALALAAGAALAQVALRFFVKTEEHWLGTLPYASAMWRTNWTSLTGGHGPDVVWSVLIYLLVAALGFFSAPLLTSILVLVTALVARIDEPRVLTMLVPFAAMTVLRWV